MVKKVPPTMTIVMVKKTAIQAAPSSLRAMAVRIGTPVSQSAAGERIFSVRDAGFAPDDLERQAPDEEESDEGK